MTACRICGTALGPPDYAAPPPAMTSLSTQLDVATEVSVCRTCGHVQSPDLPDLQAFYDQDYRISLQSDDHDQLYEMQDDRPVYRTERQAEILADLELPEGAQLLDFGAAKAVTTRRLMKMRPDLKPHVFDVSNDYRAHWADWIPDEAQATYELPDDWTGKFDVVTAHFVLEHVAEPVAILRDMKRCLAPGGMLFFSVPDPEGNAGDLLVVDHVNHFVPSSLHRALEAAGLKARAIRQDLFRGAHVVIAEEAGEDAASPAPPLVPETALAHLEGWRQLLDDLRRRLSQSADESAKVAIYGAGFYGALFSPIVGARKVCFLDRNPHLAGETMDGVPILTPEQCPEVSLVVAALNPAHARSILPTDAPWLPKAAQVLYPQQA